MDNILCTNCIMWMFNNIVLVISLQFIVQYSNDTIRVWASMCVSLSVSIAEPVDILHPTFWLD